MAAACLVITIHNRSGTNSDFFRYCIQLFSTGLRISCMKKIYCLDSCTTCQRILKEIQAEEKGFTLQNIKEEKLTASQLEEMKKLSGSYESLFSRRALKYKEMGLKDQQLTEKDYRRLILEEYTFLKRPVAILDNKIFAGSEKKTVEALRRATE